MTISCSLVPLNPWEALRTWEPWKNKFKNRNGQLLYEVVLSFTWDNRLVKRFAQMENKNLRGKIRFKACTICRTAPNSSHLTHDTYRNWGRAWNWWKMEGTTISFTRRSVYCGIFLSGIRKKSYVLLSKRNLLNL